MHGGCSAWRAEFVGDSEAARRAFQRAYTIAPTQIEVGRNLVLESLALGYGEEAVEVATAMVSLSPEGLSVFPCAGGGLNITPQWLL